MRTAEFISPKHPDKVCDIISDTILDRYLELDPYTQCNIQTSVGFNSLYIMGEIASNVHISNDTIKNLVHQICEIDNVQFDLKFDIPKTNTITKSGISIGYATTEVETKVPFEYHHARELNKFIYTHFPYSGKTQVTINGDSVEVVTSFKNSTQYELDDLIKQYFKNTEFWISKTHCNSNVDFGVIGSSGKQIVNDNYGPRIPIGGGSYSGKDATKIDRCGGYMARRIAVDSLMRYNLKYAMVELSYTNGQNTPIQARIKGNDQGINIETGIKLYEVKGYDLTPEGIINFLDMRTPIYAEVTKWGHMGNNFNWK